MRVIQSSVFRAVCAIVVGALLIKYPDNTVTWITICIGLLFFMSGIISVIAYWNARKQTSDYTITNADGQVISGGRPTFPLVGTGSLIFGALLALSPHIFISALMYILGIILIMGAVNQLWSLINANKLGKVPVTWWIFPCLIFLTGLYVMVKPMDSASLPLLILGWCSMVYGVTEMILQLMFYRIHKKIETPKE